MWGIRCCKNTFIVPLVRHNYGEVLSIDDKGIRICYGDIVFLAERAISNALFITAGMITSVDELIPVVRHNCEYSPLPCD